jgi:hypothetical protein
MRSRKRYFKATVINVEALPVRLIAVDDPSERNESRSAEVIDLAIQMIQLSSKRGRVGQLNTGVFDEAA